MISDAEPKKTKHLVKQPLSHRKKITRKKKN